VAGPCEHSNKPSSSIKGGEFHDYLSGYWLPKKDSAPWSQYLVTLFVIPRLEFHNLQTPPQWMDGFHVYIFRLTWIGSNFCRHTVTSSLYDTSQRSSEIVTGCCNVNFISCGKNRF